MSVDTSHQTLPSGLFITSGAVDLTCEKQVFNEFGFEVMMQLCGVEKVVFNGISRTVGLHIFKGRNLRKRLKLHLPRHGR